MQPALFFEVEKKLNEREKKKKREGDKEKHMYKRLLNEKNPTEHNNMHHYIQAHMYVYCVVCKHVMYEKRIKNAHIYN